MSLFNFCSCLLTSIRILHLKKNFWHGPGISSGPSLKNTVFDCIQIIFASCWNRWTISDMVNISNSFHEPFKASWLPKNLSAQNEKTRNTKLKNVNQVWFLPNLSMKMLQLLIIKQIRNITTLETLISWLFT